MASCKQCGAEIIHVRDKYTGATFPVDAEPLTFRGYELGRPGEGERNPRATRRELELYAPHHAGGCEAEEEAPEEEVPDEG